MSVDCFLDTNVIAYAFSKLPADARKRQRAEEIMRGNRYGISTQVLQELFAVLTKKAAMSLSRTDALIVIENFEGTPLALTDFKLVLDGIKISNRYQISHWDGAILAAAERLGAPTVYSEDLSDGQRYGNITVVNPFKGC